MAVRFLRIASSAPRTWRWFANGMEDLLVGFDYALDQVEVFTRASPTRLTNSSTSTTSRLGSSPEIALPGTARECSTTRIVLVCSICRSQHSTSRADPRFELRVELRDISNLGGFRQEFREKACLPPLLSQLLAGGRLRAGGGDGAGVGGASATRTHRSSALTSVQASVGRNSQN